MQPLDGLRIVKNMLQKVLDEFEVTYVWSSTASRLSAEVWIGSKRIIHTYAHTNYANGGPNSAADLRRKLVSLNARKKIAAEPLQKINEDVPLSVAIARDRTETLSAAVEADSGDQPAEDDLMLSPMDDMVDENEQPMAPTETIVADTEPEKSRAVVYPDNPRKSSTLVSELDSRLLHQTVLLQPAEVIAIELTNDLMIPKGHVLIIPLHDPSLFLDMPKSQYQALFRRIEKPSRSVSIPRIEEKAKKPRVEPKQPAPIHTPAIDEPPPKAAIIRDAPDEPPIAPPVPRSKSTTDAPIPVETSSVDGITAQLARQMAAIAYVQHHVNRGKPVRVTELAGLLDERDRKQVSGRLPHAWKLGFADRYESNGGRGLQYAITKSGMSLLSRLHTWPWLREKLPIPKWANH